MVDFLVPGVEEGLSVRVQRVRQHRRNRGLHRATERKEGE